MKSSVEQVFLVMDGEREYQRKFITGNPERSDGSKKYPEDYLIMIETYLRKAVDAYTLEKGNTPALHQIRKVTTLADRCLDEHGRGDYRFMVNDHRYTIMPQSVGGFLHYLEYLLAEARKIWSIKMAVLDEIIKIAECGIYCMEEFGAHPR
jgi:hypothetical protein